MTPFFKKAIILILPIVILMCTAIFLPPKTGRLNMLYTQIDKNKLLATTPNPRIIFVGGSNLAFGLDSKRIKDSLNINPINTGIHINLGLKYMLANTLQYIKPGDLIVLSLEYQQFYGDLADGEGELFSMVTDVVPQSKKLLDYKQYFKLLKLIPEFAQSKIRPFVLFYKFPQDKSIGIYDRKAFNLYGDAVIHWNLPGENPKPYPAIKEPFNTDALTALINFEKQISQKKATLFVSYPGYQYSSYKNHIFAIKQVERQLKAHHFTQISTPEEYIIPDGLVFDTPYHLTKKGVNYRTGLLINDLRKILK